MELSGLQVVSTVILIVVAGGIALVCDYLRHRAQHLRELAVELNVRSEVAAAAAVPAPAAASAAASRNARMRAEHQTDSQPIAVAETCPPPAAPRPTEAVAPRTRRRPAPPNDAPLPRLEDMNPRQALSDWLDQRAAARPATTIATAPERHAEPSTPSNDGISTIVRRALAARSNNPSVVAPADPRMIFDRAEAPAKRFEVIAGAASTKDSFQATLPDGMHDYAVLQRAIA